MESRRNANYKVNEVLIKGKRSDTLAIFDLDDTLILSDAKIHILDPKTHKIIKSLSPQEFNFFKPNKKVMLSFTDFEDYDILKKSTFITEVLNDLLNFYRSGIHVSIVTARSKTTMIRDFFLENGIDIHPDLVIAVNDPSHKLSGSIAERKKQAIDKLINFGYKDLIFFDDNDENLSLAKEIEKEREVNVTTIKV